MVTQKKKKKPKNTYTSQWRVQGFLEGRVNPKGGANLLFDHFPQKLHKDEEFLAGGTRPLHPPGSTNALTKHEK